MNGFASWLGMAAVALVIVRIVLLLKKMWRYSGPEYQRIKVQLIKRKNKEKEELVLLLTLFDKVSAMNLEQIKRFQGLIDEGIREIEWQTFLADGKNKKVAEYVKSYPEEERFCKTFHGFGPQPEKDWQEQVKRKWDGDLLEDLSKKAYL